LNFTTDKIQAAISSSIQRQTLEDLIEELAHEPLTPQQVRVAIELAITGQGSREIAANYGLSPRTIQSHFAEVYARTCAANQRKFLSAVICKLLDAHGRCISKEATLKMLLDPEDNAEDWELVIENGEVIARLKGEKL